MRLTKKFLGLTLVFVTILAVSLIFFTQQTKAGWAWSQDFSASGSGQNIYDWWWNTSIKSGSQSMQVISITGGASASPACGGANCTGSSSQSCNTQVCPPGAPTNLTATVINCTSVRFSWSAASGATGYYLHRDSEKCPFG